MWFLLIIGFLLGVVAVLAVQWLIIFGFTTVPNLSDEDLPFYPQFVPFNLPKELKQVLLTAVGQEQLKKKETCVSLNLLLQFLYQEFQDEKWFRRWVFKKLSIEFNDLLSRTAAGRIIQDIKIRDLKVGHQFPIIKDIQVNKATLGKDQQSLDEIELVLSIEYCGGLSVSVFSQLLLGRSAFLSVSLTRLQGSLKLRFARIPYTHWNMCFLQEPKMEFNVNSIFHGRAVPQLVPLIIAQFRRITRKKHVIPHYKLRYRPFFQNNLLIPGPNPKDFGHVRLEGALELSVLKAVRLNMSAVPKDHSEVFCVISVGAKPFLLGHNDSCYVTIALKFVRRSAAEDIGICLAKENDAERNISRVCVQSVTENSEAEAAGFRVGDLLVAVNQIAILSEKHALTLLSKVIGEIGIIVERPLNSIDDESNLTLLASNPTATLTDDDFVHIDLDSSSNVGVAADFDTIVQSGDGSSVCCDGIKFRKTVSENDLLHLHQISCRHSSGDMQPLEIDNISLMDSKHLSKSDNSLNGEFETASKSSDFVQASSNSCADKIANDSDRISVGEEAYEENATGSVPAFHQALKCDSESAFVQPNDLSKTENAIQNTEKCMDILDGNCDSVEASGAQLDNALSRKDRIRAKASAVANKLQSNSRVKRFWHNRKQEQQVDLDNSAASTNVRRRLHTSEKDDDNHTRNRPISVALDGIPSISQNEHRRFSLLENESELAANNIAILQNANVLEILKKSTRSVHLVEDPLWNEDHCVLLNQTSKYLNVSVWTRTDNAQTTTNRKSTTSSALLAYVSLYIPEILDDCSFTMSHYHQQNFPLKPCGTPVIPSNYSKLARHPGFDARLCYGEITLGFRWCPQGYRLRPPTSLSDALQRKKISSSSSGDPFSLLSDNVVVDDDSDLSAVKSNENGDVAFSDSVAAAAKPECISINGHEWCMTQFQSATMCNLCQHKVWLKSSYQCKYCLMVAHKKCISRPGKPVPECTREKCQRPLSEADKNASLEKDDKTATSQLPQQQHLQTIASTVSSSPDAKRKFYAGLTQRISDFRKRRRKDIAADDLPSLFEEQPGDIQGYSEIKFDSDSAINDWAYNESVINAAKNLGKELFVNLPTTERKTKLNDQIDKLQTEINEATKGRLAIIQEKNAAAERCRKVELESELMKLDEKIQALAVLMLHYCAGLQHCLDMEELEEAAKSSLNDANFPTEFASSSILEEPSKPSFQTAVGGVDSV